MKLFKKVMASVLAGVMALSMVACGTASVVPTPPTPVAPTTSVEADVLAAVNFMRNEEKGHFVDAVQVKEGDAVRDALADTIAALLSADPNRDIETAVWTRDGKVYVPAKTIYSVMHRKGFIHPTDYDLNNIYVVANDVIVKVNKVEVTGVASDADDKTVTCLEFTVGQVQKSKFGSYAQQQLANVGYKMASQPSDIGIAQVKTNGNAIVLVSKADLSITPNGNLVNFVGGNDSTAN